MFELSENLYETYKEADEQGKSIFLQNIMVELLVENKKDRATKLCRLLHNRSAMAP